MRCPFCQNSDTKVLDSRPNEDKTAIRRRRECLECFKRFTTFEKIEEAPVVVVKRDGRKELFNRSKIIRGLTRATEKRNISFTELEKLVDNIEKDLANRLVTEITSKEIGEMVLVRLRKLDEVAYVRFASVYKDFKDIEAFKKELSKL
ncbi:transcriptional regulator NrdR [Anaerobranca gottschalkii]|uniref:Transcriptional repressor NrdR n=1 Tax=Anaerobranca gottschalkii DSM 13577 TaxID=1120990 RepID=A0A1H9YW42_9FIRM|nr:transcriptional regulator NrdR [Anaerobranca gottschalkii]SES73342.1 transcriptional repressor NrdR [Anaerobranca gottschalkii DSM 13577]